MWGIGDTCYGRWEAQGGSQADPRLERKLDPSPFGDLPSVRLVSLDST